jgi:hypothetical protein
MFQSTNREEGHMKWSKSVTTTRSEPVEGYCVYIQAYRRTIKEFGVPEYDAASLAEWFLTSRRTLNP